MLEIHWMLALGWSVAMLLIGGCVGISLVNEPEDDEEIYGDTQ